MRQKGFNLIELLIAVAVIGILTAVAYPSYTGYVQTTRRVDAKAALMTLANAMERNHSLVDSYVGVGANADGTGAPKASLYTVPSGIAEYYDVKIITAATNTFELSAKPQNGQASDSCGELTITETGYTTAAKAGCW